MKEIKKSGTNKLVKEMVDYIDTLIAIIAANGCKIALPVLHLMFIFYKGDLPMKPLDYLDDKILSMERVAK